MIKYFRNLPHYQPLDSAFLITFRLAGSIPDFILKNLRLNYESERKKLISKYYDPSVLKAKLYELQKMNFAKYDSILDKCEYGPKYLLNEDIASIIYKKIFELNSVKYELITFDIEPNHVHLVIFLLDNIKVSELNNFGKTKNYALADTLRLIKGSTARESNLILNRTGQFWHHESFDHVVRDEFELKRIVKYIMNNPVRSGMTDKQNDWKWSYCVIDYSLL